MINSDFELPFMYVRVNLGAGLPGGHIYCGAGELRATSPLRIGEPLFVHGRRGQQTNFRDRKYEPRQSPKFGNVY
jgi:hypothetical protein